MNLLKTLISANARKESLLIVTGAGMSVASGIPAFRSGPGAIWDRSVVEKGTLLFFERNPVESWKWYLRNFGSMVGGAFTDYVFVPNVGHTALADLEQFWDGHLVFVTQNVDTLHEQAGSSVIKCHGSADRVRCSRTGCLYGAPGGSLRTIDTMEQLKHFYANPRFETLPRCPVCGKVLRPHTLWFDECYTDHEDYEFKSVLDGARDADVVLFIGTSFSVRITSIILEIITPRGIPWFVIDPNYQEPEGFTANPEQVIRQRQELYLPSLVEELCTDRR